MKKKTKKKKKTRKTNKKKRFKKRSLKRRRISKFKKRQKKKVKQLRHKKVRLKKTKKRKSFFKKARTGSFKKSIKKRFSFSLRGLFKKFVSSIVDGIHNYQKKRQLLKIRRIKEEQKRKQKEIKLQSDFRKELLKKEIKENGGTAEAFPVDVTNPKLVNNVASEITNSFGHIDVLVTTVAIPAFGPFAKIDADVFRAALETKYLGYIDCFQAALPHMITNINH